MFSLNHANPGLTWRPASKDYRERISNPARTVFCRYRLLWRPGLTESLVQHQPMKTAHTVYRAGGKEGMVSGEIGARPAGGALCHTPFLFFPFFACYGMVPSFQCRGAGLSVALFDSTMI